MSTPTTASVQEQRPPWFAGRTGIVLLYRINRRPLARPTLGGGQQPASIMDHIVEVLPFGSRVVTGTRQKRDWILGNRRISADESALSGQIGWEQRGDEPTSRYQPETREWLDVVEPQEHSARAPFVFDGRSRILGVLKHRSFSESTVAKVMQTLLRQGEEQREWPTTEWSVEAILDERDFLSWLHSVQAVTSIKLVTKMPNPDGLDEFGPIWEEMNQRRARLISTRMVAANENEGLEGLEDDERVRGSLAMGRRGFGYVEARGNRNGHETVYDQREKVSREVTDELAPTWSGAVDMMLEVVRRSASRVLEGRDRRSE
jgi:hypothetical protein